MGGVPTLYHHQDNNQNCGFYFEPGQTSFKMGEERKMVLAQSGTKFLGNVSFS
jgi:hypothetical protein